VTASLPFATLFDTYYPKLYAYIRSQVADQPTAEDLTAATFERAFSHSHQFDPQKGSFAIWLFRIGRNLVINHYAATSRKPLHYDLDEVISVAGGPSPEQRLLHQEQQRLLTETLATLPERDQEIIQLRFYGRLTNRDIAEVLELNEKTVSVIILRALQKLRARLEPQETA
jgi:RNA polymerase sigma-70 factor (ECF subfamily)